uniref:Uncharacterized protein n=2 Tax=Pseudoalteromonas rubra TaxID=43658 RepID=A0A0F4QXW8_9GAMM|nr:hypothetical protein TW77_05990 [Pseudoalteromonas rubra]
MGLQVKGTGRNLLVGISSDFSHAHGGLLLSEAVEELIYSNFLKQIMPKGVAAVHAVISTPILISENEHTAQLAQAALLVREPIARLGHFMAAQDFAMSEPAKRTLTTERIRLARIYGQFKNTDSQHQAIHQLLETVIKNNCQQFAFAKIMQIAHGSSTPSNIGLDGRWLDLSTASFVPLNADHQLCPYQLPFSQEHLVISEAVKDIVYHINKFIDPHFSGEPYLTAIEVHMSHFLHFYTKKAFGLPTVHLKNPSISKSEQFLTIWLMQRIARADKLIFANPLNTHEVHKQLDELCDAYFGDSDLAAHFHQVSVATYQSKYQQHISYKAFLTWSFIKGFRYLYLATIFFRGAVKFTINRTLDFTSVIEEYLSVSQWAFSETNNGKVIIIKTYELEIIYDIRSQRYSMQSQGVDRASSDSLSDLPILEQSLKLSAIGFDLADYYKTLCQKLELL